MGVSNRQMTHWLIYYPALPTHLGTWQSGKQCINLCQREINGNQAPNSLSCFGKSRPFSTYHKSNLKENLFLPVNILHLPSHDLFPLKFIPQHLLLGPEDQVPPWFFPRSTDDAARGCYGFVPWVRVTSSAHSYPRAGRYRESKMKVTP